MAVNAKHLTFIWKIKNISYGYYKENLYSPSFYASELLGSKWSLLLQNSKDAMSCRVKREYDSDGPNELQLDFELSFLAADESVLHSQIFNKKGCKKDNVENSLKLSVQKNEISERNKDLFTFDDTLTICCRMWDSQESILKSRRCLAETIIEKESRYFFGTVEKFSNLEPNSKYLVCIKSSSTQNFFSTMNLCVSTDSKLEIEMKPVDYGHLHKYECKIFIQHVPGKKLAIGQCKFHDKKTQCVPLNISKEFVLENKEYFLSNDVLTIKCEVTFPTGLIKEKGGNESVCEDNKKVLSDAKNTSSYSEENRAKNDPQNEHTCKDFQSLTTNLIGTSSSAEVNPTKSDPKSGSADKDGQEIISNEEKMSSEKNHTERILESDSACKDSQGIISNSDKTSKSSEKNHTEHGPENGPTSEDTQGLISNPKKISSPSEENRTKNYTKNESACNNTTEIISNPKNMSSSSEEKYTEEFTTLRDDWMLLYMGGVLSDAKLMTATETFQVHKAVLIARSPVFKSEFTTDAKEKDKNFTEIYDLDEDTVRRMLLFMYSDSLDDLEFESAKKLYFAAYKYNIVSLKLRCSNFLKQNLQQSNYSEILHLAKKYQDEDLANAVHDFIKENDESILNSCEWMDLEENFPRITTEVFRFIYMKKRENSSSDERNTERFTTLKEDWISLYNEGTLSDAEVKTATETFSVHKAVLGARSNVFKSMFTTDMKEKAENQVDIEDLDADTVHRMLLFIYSETLDDLEYESAERLLVAADKYNIVSLRFRCRNFLKQNLLLSNYSKILLLAHKHQDEHLLKAVQDFIAENDESVLNSEEWKDLEENFPRLTTKVFHFIYLKQKKK